MVINAKAIPFNSIRFMIQFVPSILHRQTQIFLQWNALFDEALESKEAQRKQTLCMQSSDKLSLLCVCVCEMISSSQ